MLTGVDASDVGTDRILLSDAAWRARFSADESIVGRQVSLGGASRTVIGILPPRFVVPATSLFFGADQTGHTEFVSVGPLPSPGRNSSPVVIGGMAVDAIVRLEDGVSQERAQAELDAIVAATPATRPADKSRALVLEDVRTLVFPAGRHVLLLLMAAAGFVLLIGCSNLAAMLGTRMRRRYRELAIQAAVGAGRLRLARPILLEAALIGVTARSLPSS